MFSFIPLRKEFPRPSVGIFLFLQALDVLTTLIGLRLGAAEASLFVGRVIQFGPVMGLLISKFFALILLMAAFAFHRPRLVVFLNYWFAALVTWNLLAIVLQMWPHITT